MGMGTNGPFWAIFFWVNVAVCSILAIVVIRIVNKYEARRKQLEKDIKTPGLQNLGWFFKHKLKEHDIEVEKQITEPPKTDLN